MIRSSFLPHEPRMIYQARMPSGPQKSRLVWKLSASSSVSSRVGLVCAIGSHWPHRHPRHRLHLSHHSLPSQSPLALAPTQMKPTSGQGFCAAYFERTCTECRAASLEAECSRIFRLASADHDGRVLTTISPLPLPARVLQRPTTEMVGRKLSVFRILALTRIFRQPFKIASTFVQLKRMLSLERHWQ